MPGFTNPRYVLIDVCHVDGPSDLVWVRRTFVSMYVEEVISLHWKKTARAGPAGVSVSSLHRKVDH